MAISKITSNSIDFSVGTSWQSVFTGDGSTGLTAVAGEGYFIDTTNGTVTVTLPSSPTAGDAVVLKDYARTWATNNVTIASALFDGVTSTTTFSTNGQTATLVYMDGTKGWSLVNDDTVSKLGPLYVTATGGTVTTSGDYKIHTFTGDGCFVVSQLATSPTDNVLDYLVVAGGGGAAGNHGGAGGAGGLRYYLNTANSPTPAFPGSPINNYPSGTSISVTASTYPITVGGGGANGVATPGASSTTRGTSGSNSVLSTITSAGGGGGGGTQTTPSYDGIPGGSGGGAGTPYPSGSAGSVGSGNTPPTSPPQGNNGGAAKYGPGWISAGGGGGATAVGTSAPTPQGGPGPAGGLITPAGLGGDGAGFTSNVFGSGNGECSSCTQYFAGGGGGGGSLNAPDAPTCAQNPAGGLGGGGNGAGNDVGVGQNGTTNTGGGAGGGGNCANGGSGGSGVVVIRYKYQ